MRINTVIQEMRELLRMEEETQERKWFEKDVSLKDLRKEGAILHPVKIQNKTFGYTDQPVITVTFHTPGGVNNSYYSQGTPVALFLPSSNDICNGQLLSISDRKAEILLYSEDFPDWIDEKNLGIKRLPDNRTFQMMHGVLKRIDKGEDKATQQLFEYVHGIKKQKEIQPLEKKIKVGEHLNQFQLKAVENGLCDAQLQIIHGPPGTGKTTTIVELIQSLRKQGLSIIASAPSNAAVDHLAQQLLNLGLKVLRLGNTAKVNKVVWEHTPEGILSDDKYSRKIKRLKIQAAEYRKMAHQYKRSFGKSEREQRKLLFNEVYAIRDQIRNLSTAYLAQFFESADVILGTPIGLMDKMLLGKKFDVAFLDEAGQCIEPLAWLVLEKANRAILSGDHLQLPPTVISEEAGRKGLATSVLERAINAGVQSDLLGVQYRMTPEIAGFSSRYFYDGKLQTHAESVPESMIFYDTAGAGFDEKRLENSRSTANPEELRIVRENIENWVGKDQSAVFISPYSSQVELAKEELKDVKVSTIDAFQGQEADVIILSLVRSNGEGKIGFLSDYRRMNVALTRAKKKLIVIGDSATLANDKFYKEFVEYAEEVGGYRSVFELMY
ncbi:AAA domain-containing protein [Brumimicrobium mesophilum]|uniref:AAA domain-containing protein n=1 Tax=Brumimicrobium mesophilum TaxID=392717 RepID=UPI000D142C80|nr:AAA domain-containing protein [Brumimicrobium mesophilum]